MKPIVYAIRYKFACSFVFPLDIHGEIWFGAGSLLKGSDDTRWMHKFYLESLGICCLDKILCFVPGKDEVSRLAFPLSSIFILFLGFHGYAVAMRRRWMFGFVLETLVKLTSIKKYFIAKRRDFTSSTRFYNIIPKAVLDLPVHKCSITKISLLR